MSQFVYILTFHVGPGHGWLELPATLVDQLQILPEISNYSFYSHTNRAYYLEEDCDAPLALEAMKAKGMEYAIREGRGGLDIR